MVWAIVPFEARIVEVKVTLELLSNYVILLTILHLYVTPKRHHESTCFGKAFGSQDAWLFVDFIVHCTPLLLYFSVSLSISILLRVHASVLFKVALIVSTIELASFQSARGSLYEPHRYYISFDSAY